MLNLNQRLHRMNTPTVKQDQAHTRTCLSSPMAALHIPMTTAISRPNVVVQPTTTWTNFVALSNSS
jgi:hypothetical protein